MKTKYLAFAVVATMLAACTNNDPVVDETKDTPITIASAGVAELTTRAIADGELVGVEDGEDATMSVFVTGGSDDIKYNATNMKWEHDGTAWSNKSESTVYYEGTSSSQQIYACSPFSDGSTGSITVDATGQTDWLVATATGLESNSVTLTMTHALAKLVLEPTFGNELTNQEISSVKVGGMYASGTLNISDNTWTLGDSPATTDLTMTNNELLIIPMAECESFPITITMADSRTFKTTISLTSVDNKLDAGTQYNIALQVGQDKVTLGGITASSWGIPVDGGQLETE